MKIRKIRKTGTADVCASEVGNAEKKKRTQQPCGDHSGRLVVDLGEFYPEDNANLQQEQYQAQAGGEKPGHFDVVA